MPGKMRYPSSGEMQDSSVDKRQDPSSGEMPEPSTGIPAQPSSDMFAHRLFDSYDRYRERALYHRRFKYQDIVPLLHEIGEHPEVDLIREGKSTGGRTIYRIRMGSGDTSVLLWSQMHGDEPTATMALFDLFRFLTARDEHDEWRNAILRNVTIHAVPMLNPDAADLFQRHTPLGIDMNRDALQRQCPESRLLKRIRHDLNADFGFNLHDQSTRYSVGETSKSTVIAFLAPAYNAERSVNPVRKRSMQVIAGLSDMLQAFIPGHVATYSDEYEPRAFGDQIQKWGTSAILVESGGMKDDPEKQGIRKLNYVLLLEALRSIATADYESCPVDRYEAIPPNRFRLYDTILRNVTLHSGDRKFVVDIGMNRIECNTEGALDYYERGEITEVGDLSGCNGYDERDMTGLRGVAGAVSPEAVTAAAELDRTRAVDLLRLGFTAVRVEGLPEKPYTGFPLNIVGNMKSRQSGTLPESPANLVLYDGDEPVYVVINGNLVDVRPEADIPGQLEHIRNALVFH